MVTKMLEKQYFTKKKTYNIVLTALLFAITIILAVIENILPPIPVNFAGIKFGISNVAIMFSLFFVSKISTLSIVILKAGFVLVTRGVIASFLSILGGIFSLLIMIILLLIFKDKISYLIISISGAIFHNFGQFIGILLIYDTFSLVYYTPVLLIAGIISGSLTAILLRTFIPIFKKLKL